MKEDLVVGQVETNPKLVEAPLTPEELAALEKQYAVETPANNGNETVVQVEAARAAYEADLAARAKRMNMMVASVEGKSGERFTEEGLMQEDAERENHLRSSREQNQKRWEKEAEKANKGKVWYKRLFSKKITVEDIMRDEAERDHQEETWREGVKDTMSKLFSGEIALDSASVIEPLRDVNKVYGVHTMKDIFLEDMLRERRLNDSKIRLFREVVGTDASSNQYYKEILLKALAEGLTDTLYTRDFGLTGKFAEFNDDPQFVASARRILAKKNMNYR